MIGIPIDPNATGAVFASRQIADALNGENPSPINMLAAIATGVPNPAAPSRNAPNANAISNACSRGSGVSRPIEFLIISNCPVSTVTRNSAIAQKISHVIGNSPNATPNPAALTAVTTAILYASVASANVTTSPHIPANHAGLRSTPSSNSSVNMGRAANSTETPRPWPNSR